MSDFKFIDLFCGVGGMRMAFQMAGGECVFSSEIDKYAQKTYMENWGECPSGNIRDFHEKDIPDHDVLVGGFPCQTFSSAGVSWSKTHGKPHGFMDKTRGTLFFDIIRILKEKRPKAFLLENVKNLVHHDKGKTFQTIKNSIEELDYHYFYTILNSQSVVPQKRERIFIVGFRDHWQFDFPKLPQINPKLRDILEPSVDDKYTLTDAGFNCLKVHAARHKAKGNGFSYNLADLDGVSATLLARYYKDGSNILIPQEGKNPRKLTPRECARLMGFPDEFKLPCSDTRLYKQFGNSVVIPVVSEVARAIAAKLKEPTGFRLMPPE